jgi:elongation factor Ts
MTKISVDKIKQLRQETSCGVIDCKEALREAEGDLEKAKQILRQKGLELAAKKAGRATNAGRIESYVHLGNKIGVLVEVDCETDFVAKNEDFVRFTRDLAMQVAATNPKYLRREDVPVDLIKDQDHEDFFRNNCLMDQLFIKDQKITIKDYLNSLVAKIGENIIVRRFTRLEVGIE